MNELPFATVLFRTWIGLIVTILITIAVAGGSTWLPARWRPWSTIAAVLLTGGALALWLTWWWGPEAWHW